MNNHIQSVSAKNFRSWQDLYVEFCPGVNIIIGENDNGKTNILRLINWIVNNRPLGDDIRSNWGGDTEGKLELNNTLIGRTKTDNDNYYTLTQSDGSEEIFRAFNKGVPEQIKQFINFSDVNIGFQLDGPFLLGKSPSDVARYYNEAVNLDIIDRSISNISKTLKLEKTQKAKIESDIEKHQSDLEKLSWLDEVEPKIIQLEKLEKDIQKKNNEFSKLSELKYVLEKHESDLKEVKKITVFEDRVNDLINLEEDLNKKQLEFQELKNYISRLKSLDEQELEIQKIILFEDKVLKLISLDQKISNKTLEYNKLGNFIKDLEYLDQKESEIKKIVSKESVVLELIETNQKIKFFTTEYNELLDYIEKIEKYNNIIEKLSIQIEIDEENYKKMLPDLCPVLQIECQNLIKLKNGK